MSRLAAPGILTPLVVLALLFTCSCSSYEHAEKERAERAKKAKGDILVGLVWQTELYKTYFFEGAELAVEEINRSGGINGRKIRTVRFYNEAASLKKERELARKIAGNYDMVAVVGHYMEQGSVEASITYEYSGIIYIASSATSPKFSKHGFQYVFRNIPSDADNGVLIADFLKARDFNRVVVLDDRSLYGKGIADTFYARAGKIGLAVLARSSYDRWGRDFKPLFAGIRKLSPDVIFLGAGVPEAGEVMKQARIMGVTAPFIGGNGLDSLTLWDIAGRAAEGTMTTTVFHRDEKDPGVQEFDRKFRARFKADPDTWAAVGYDGISVLAEAYRKAGTTVPVVAASHLRFMKGWHGVLGPYAFQVNGDITGDVNSFQMLHNGKFEAIEGGKP